MSLIVANSIIFCMRLWAAHSLFGIFRYRWQILIVILISSGISATLLWSLPQLMGTEIIQQTTITSLIALTGLILITWCLGRVHHLSRQTIRHSLVFMVIYLVGIGVIMLLPADIRITATLFRNIALIEERIKYASADHTHHHRSIQETDIILLVMIAALSYARWENILIATDTAHIIARAPTYLIHVVFASIVGIGFSRHAWSVRIIMIIMATTLHLWYNLAHGHIHWSLMIIVIIGLYLGLSYILYHQDSIYLPRRNQLASST